jgi:sterol desaturase/sphingolipid hydroxylase (fatty acid hydroxylase superfamily)
MNRTQKKAWFGLAGFLFSDLLLGIYFVVMFIPHGTPLRIILGFAAPAVTLLVLGVLLWRFRQKQSPFEPAEDERDRTIVRNAVLVSFVSVWLLLTAATVIPIVLRGAEGSVPVAVLPIIHIGIFMAAMTVYYAAVLISYQINRGNI